MGKYYELTKPQVEKANKWIGEKGINRHKCPLCNFHGGMAVLSRLVEIKSLGGTLVYPYFVWICTNCSHQMFFNALSSEVVTKEDIHKNSPNWKDE